jgi:2,3-bisphosphoglycerate-dependent phosphoglycerate mutase
MPPDSFQITLLRHGESIGNANGQIQGHSDHPLSERGREQAHCLARRWQAEEMTFDQVITSPLLRAHETARILTTALDLPLELNPLWMERNFGQLEGKLIQEVRRQLSANPLFHPYIPAGVSGESLLDTYQRACQAIQDLMHREPARYLVVSHGAFLNMVLYSILGIDPQKFATGPRFIFENAAYAQLAYDPERGMWQLLGFNLGAPLPHER